MSKPSTFVATVRKSGNSKVVTIPDGVAKLYELGTELEVTVCLHSKDGNYTIVCKC